jgi:starvation-inducible DNA-binding protein
MAAASSTLPELPTDITDGMDYVKAVVARLAAFANSTREAIEWADKLGDAGTADLFTEVSRSADKHLCFLEAHLQDQRPREVRA